MANISVLHVSLLTAANDAFNCTWNSGKTDSDMENYDGTVIRVRNEGKIHQNTTSLRHGSAHSEQHPSTFSSLHTLCSVCFVEVVGVTVTIWCESTPPACFHVC